MLTHHNGDDDALRSWPGAPDDADPCPDGHEIVLLEDSVMLRAAMAMALRNDGFVVHAAGAAPHAMALLRTNISIVAVIMEIDLGAGGGESRALLTDFKSAWPRLAVIVLTGRPDLLLGHIAGPREAHLLKPCPMKRVIATVRGLIAT